MRKKVKFLLLLLLGILIFTPFLFLSVMFQVMAGFSFYGVLFSLSFLVPFAIYCYLLYCYMKRGKKVKYPIVPPEGRTDIYFPRTDIPRPIHEDVRRYPRFFGRKGKKKKKSERMEKVRRKK